MVITYVYPIVSARAITLIPEFLKVAECKFYLKIFSINILNFFFNIIIFIVLFL
jgi:hypothetical protein